jgi:hypothetical protein
VLRYCCEKTILMLHLVRCFLGGEVCDVMFVFVRVHIGQYIFKERTHFHKTCTKIVHVCIKFSAIFNVPAWRSYELMVL